MALAFRIQESRELRLGKPHVIRAKCTQEKQSLRDFFLQIRRKNGDGRPSGGQTRREGRRSTRVADQELRAYKGNKDKCRMRRGRGYLSYG